MMQGGMTPQQQLEMQRLAQQQQLIQKSLEQLMTRQSFRTVSNFPLTLIILKKCRKLLQICREKTDDQLIQKQEIFKQTA